NTLPEQAASIRSFLTYAGRPKQFVVVSDGSYTSTSIELLEKIDNTVRVQKILPSLPPGLSGKIQSYLTTHPTGKQLALLMSPPNFFTNQTVMHLCMHANGAVPFDPDKFVLKVDDQFIYRDQYAGPSIAIRHYVNPIRHKFWTTLMRRLPK